jgi:hypothetical protein
MFVVDEFIEMCTFILLKVYVWLSGGLTWYGCCFCTRHICTVLAGMDPAIIKAVKELLFFLMYLWTEWWQTLLLS